MIFSRENIKNINISALIRDSLTEGNLETILFIVPTNRWARTLKKELIESSPNRSSEKINIETLTTITQKLLQSYDKYELISSATSYVFLKETIEEAEIEYFDSYKNDVPDGTLEELNNVIGEYKKEGIDSARLLASSEELSGYEKAKVFGIARIIDIYTKKCFAARTVEIGDIYSIIANLPQEKFSELFNKNFPSAVYIYINGFNEFSSLELNIINKLSFIGGIKIFVNLDYNPRNEKLHKHLTTAYESFIAYDYNVLGDINDHTKSSLYLKEYLSQNFLRSVKKKEDLFPIIKLEGEDRYKEVELIAREIKLLINEGIEPHKIAVVFNLIKEYSPLVREIFSIYEIPFNLSDRYSLDTIPVISSIINFLEIEEEDYYYKSFFRGISSKFLSISDTDFTKLLKISSELRIISGYKNWVDSINIQLSKGDDPELTNALKGIKYVHDTLKPFVEPQPIESFLENLKNLIQNTGLFYKMLQSETDNAEKNVKALSVFYESIFEVLIQMKTYDGESKLYSLTEYLNILRTICKWSRFNVKERSDYGIQITTLEEIRGLDFDYIFIGGLCDGDLPTKQNSDIFLFGDVKKQIEMQFSKDAYKFYQTLSMYKKGIYVSTPAFGKNSNFEESYLIKALDRILNITSKNAVDYQNAIFSKKEFFIEVGKLRGDELRVIKSLEDKIGMGEPAQSNSELEKLIKVRRDLDRYSTFYGDENIIDNNRKISVFNDIEIDQIRIDKKKKSEYNGFIGETYLLPPAFEKVYSITQLETYAKCPYKYFVERILYVDTIEDPDENITSLEIGSLLHTVLYKFYLEILKKSIVLKNCSNEVFNYSLDLIMKIGKDELDEYRFDREKSFYEIEQIFGIEGDREKSILFQFVSYERENNNGFKPSYFELEFGMNGSLPIVVNDVKIKGKIDRIDISGNTIGIIDYKKSIAQVVKKDIIEGLSLQLTIYIAATLDILKNKLEKEMFPEFVSYYSLKYNRKDFGLRKFPGNRDKNELEYYIELSKKHIKNYVESIDKGIFNLTNVKGQKKPCNNCDFSHMCRIAEFLPY
ncbi:MAG: exodeoxyribonuclease V subunit gamma [Ignavibacteriaceae bacterium]|jgi:ATP-dependent helicase/nuclease subunit B|nr:exodeoxyribonuclease V subunit gamma [Ignavibacteriaceae bacterium]